MEIRHLTVFVLARTSAPVIPRGTLQLESKTAHLTWGIGASDAIMERACLDFGENREPARTPDCFDEWKKGLDMPAI